MKMKVFTKAPPAHSFIFLFLLGFASCTQESAVSFPFKPSKVETPNTISFELPELVPVIWKFFPADSIPNYKPNVTVQTCLLDLSGSHDDVVLCIKDYGSGIPKAIRDKNFQSFFITKPTGSETGLGLSLSNDIVKSHGGDLRVKSQSIGEVGTEQNGAGMIIFLPIEI
jgi:hypothetical protein